MNSLLIYPLSLLLAILWYKPTQDGEQRVLPFALVTTFDLLALFVFLFKKQIGHWHGILISNIEQGHLKAGSVDDASVTLMGQGNEQVEHHDSGARPDTPRSEMRQIQVMQNPRSVVGWSGGPAAGGRGFSQILDSGETRRRFAGAETATQGPSNVGWGTRMVRSTNEGEVMEEGRADLGLGQQEQQRGFFIDLGMEIDNESGFETIYPSARVGTPTTIYSNIHPALRSKFDDTRPVSPNGFQTTKEALSPTGTSVLGLNQI
jgi:hypothetical protein